MGHSQEIPGLAFFVQSRGARKSHQDRLSAHRNGKKKVTMMALLSLLEYTKNQNYNYCF